MCVSVLNRTAGLDGRIVRIFNTYGPRMASGDGRVIPNFITQAIAGKPVTVYGDGTQTRSFCYVSDLVEYILRAAVFESAKHQVINIGNPDEWTIGDFAKKVIEMTQSQSEIVFEPLPTDDPTRRKPDITKAIQLLSYQPQVALDQGLALTMEWFRNQQSS
jgi:nucleoside-diphosphate-sugar epimerase